VKHALAILWKKCGLQAEVPAFTTVDAFTEVHDPIRPVPQLMPAQTFPGESEFV
jgi:hypothetical protein